MNCERLIIKATRPQLCLQLISPHHSSSYRESSPLAPSSSTRAPPSSTMTPTSSHPFPSFNDLPTEIIPRLYLGDLYHAESKDVLERLGITHILSAMGGIVRIPDLQIRHYQIPLLDAPFSELASYLPSSTAFLREALKDVNARVLVHCFRGVSRSASVVAALLIAEYGWSTMQAVQYIKSKRPKAEPNFGFVSQLKEYSRSLGHFL
jgi:Dual specificity phosphatase, catalytic domain